MSPLAPSVRRWSTPKRCCSSITASAEVPPRHPSLEQRVGADHDRQEPSASARRMAARDLPVTEPVSSATGSGQSRSSVRRCCLGQDLGRRHQGSLRPGLHRAQHGKGRHQRLAGADVALQQPQSSGAEPRGRRRSRPVPRPGTAWAHGRTGPGHVRAGRRRRATPGPARALARPARDGQHDLIGQQLVVGEPSPGDAGRGGDCGRLHVPQRVGEAGPRLALQQRRVVPLRHLRDHARARRPSACGDAKRTTRR